MISNSAITVSWNAITLTESIPDYLQTEFNNDINVQRLTALKPAVLCYTHLQLAQYREARRMLDTAVSTGALSAETKEVRLR